MSRPTAAFCSFRLGGADGVSVETRKWEWALRELGFATRRVAGELVDDLRPDDVWVPFLAIDPPAGARVEPDVLAGALAGADLVIVENLCSLPLNLDAATTASEVLDAHTGRVLFHHHDLPWERPNLAHIEGFPPRRQNSLHVTINEQARSALVERGIEATTIRNAFDLTPHPGDRAGTRAEFEFLPDACVVLQPTRAIPRKEVGRGIDFAQRLGSVLSDPVAFWLTGPAEDGFGPELEQLVQAAAVPVHIGRAARAPDAYAASDVVVFPSSWEGFGNPVIEAIIARRPIAVAHYPVLDELVALGLDLFSVDETDAVAGWLRDGDERVLESNLRTVHEHFDLRDLPDRISRALSAVGWDSW